MTVGIALLSAPPNVTPVITLVADRMITIRDLEYEPPHSKILPMAEKTVALVAGAMEFHGIIRPRVLERLGSFLDGQGNILVKSIADTYADEFSKYRRELAERELLAPLGLTLDTFVQRHRELEPNAASNIMDDLRDFRLQAETIIAGTDHTGGHIYKVVDPGEAYCYDTSGFAAIGVGDRHAESYLMGAGSQSHWLGQRQLMAGYVAKRRAEAAAGVGLATDVVTIGVQGIGTFTADELAVLERTFKVMDQETKDAEERAHQSLADEIARLSQPPDKESDHQEEETVGS